MNSVDKLIIGAGCPSKALLASDQEKDSKLSCLKQMEQELFHSLLGERFSYYRFSLLYAGKNQNRIDDLQVFI